MEDGAALPSHPPSSILHLRSSKTGGSFPPTCTRVLRGVWGPRGKAESRKTARCPTAFCFLLSALPVGAGARPHPSNCGKGIIPSDTDLEEGACLYGEACVPASAGTEGMPCSTARPLCPPRRNLCHFAGESSAVAM